MPDQILIDQLDREIESQLAGNRPASMELAALAEICAQLIHLPDENFKQRLKSDLERRATMPVTASPVRAGFRTVTPYITVLEADRFIAFLKQTFDAEEVSRHSHGPGFHAEVRIGDEMLMIGPAQPGHEAPAILHVYVNDCDATFARAISAGGKSMGEPADRPYGERSGFVVDPFGNTFYIANRLNSALAPEGAGNILPYLHPLKVRPYIEFLRQAFGAVEMAVHEHEGRVVHGTVRIGDSVVEMGEPDEPQAPSAFFMYVENIDAVYQQAIAAGAASLRPPTDEPAGHRGAAFRDPAGYTWYAATPL
jgi:PhnB protein